MTADDLSSRIRRIEDRLEIAELPARYSRCLDDRDYAKLADVFCEDATFEHVGGEAHLVGLDVIEGYLRNNVKHVLFSLHIPHAQVVERLERDHAEGWVSAHAEMSRDDGLMAIAVRYVDDYRREGGRWKIAHRRVNFFYFTRWEELASVASTRLRWTYPGPPRAAGLPESLDTYQASLVAGA